MAVQVEDPGRLGQGNYCNSPGMRSGLRVRWWKGQCKEKNTKDDFLRKNTVRQYLEHKEGVWVSVERKREQLGEWSERQALKSQWSAHKST